MDNLKIGGIIVISICLILLTIYSFAERSFFTYQTKLNKLYNILDLYLVTSRVEGGPQAILECGITKTPILSTDVGVASEILHPDSLYNENNFLKAKTNSEFAYKNIGNLLSHP